MARPSKFTPEKKQQIVLSVLRGEMKIAEAARDVGDFDRARPRRAGRRSSSTRSLISPTPSARHTPSCGCSCAVGWRVSP
jgi:transposase-like protein